MIYSFTDFISSEHSNKPHFAVVGHPISHSLSPLMHQTALDYHKMDSEYVALDLPPPQLSDFISWCNNKNFLGCNITIPHKEEFTRVVDEIDSLAAKVGVINTIVKRDHKLIGYNTDVFGFLKSLTPHLNETETGRAIIFGTGGASKAVKTAFEYSGVDELIFVSRHPSGKQIESDTAFVRVVDYHQWQEYAGETEIFVNTTPVGMYPDPDATFITPSESVYFQGKICYDLIYNPIKTTFLEKAEQNGATIISGLDMLIYQGNKSFELWTGKSFPIDKIRQVLIDKLKGAV